MPSYYLVILFFKIIIIWNFTFLSISRWLGNIYDGKFNILEILGPFDNKNTNFIPFSASLSSQMTF